MDNTKKKNIKRAVLWGLLAVLVVLLAIMPMLAQQEQEEDGPVASVLEATVQVGSISTTLRGGGTLEAGKTMDVTLPSGVKITEFLVKNGDSITEGTPVAAVDRVSVMNAILEVEDTLDYLRGEIADAEDEKVSSSIRATAGGRVKQVFAQPGERVQDVMLEHGALAVLSLDGRMAVDLERDTNLAAGDTVTVIFADGEEVDGRVESNLNGTLVVTVEDDKYEVDTLVTVTTEDGDRLGKGALYVHNAWKATAYSGTVNTVSAKVDSEVADGALLLTLKDTDYEGTMQSLSNLHREYEELLQELFQMYETEVITAPCNGMVSGVDEDSEFLLSAIEGENGWFVDLLGNETSGEDKGWTIRLLSNETADCKNQNTAEPVCNAATHQTNCYYYCAGQSDNSNCTAKDHVRGCYYFCTGTANCTAKDGEHNMKCLSLCKASDGTTLCPAFNHKDNCIEKCDNNKETEKCPATGKHKPGCIESCVSADGVKTQCPATGAHKDDCIGKCDETEQCPATTNHKETCLTRCDRTANCPAVHHKADCYLAKLTYYGKVSWIQQIGIDGAIVRQDNSTNYQMKLGTTGWTLVNPTILKTETLVTEGKMSLADVAGCKAGDVVFSWVGYNEKNEAVKKGTFVYTNIPVTTGDGTGSSGMDMSGLMAGMDLSSLMGSMSGISGISGMTGSMAGLGTTQQVELYSLDGNTLMTITDLEVVTVELAIDEHDIAKVSVGQPASVEITALKGETFEAEVTDIANYGTNNGGSAKFAVEVTLGYDPRLLVGFNATAAIPLATKMDVLTIPVAALVETEAGTFVFTGLDKETGKPTNPVPVEIGVSDGETAEVISGLGSGETVYYEFYDKVEMDNTAKAEITFG